MASLYTVPNSRFIRIRYRLRGKMVRESTGFDKEDPEQWRRAHELRAEKTLQEVKRRDSGLKGDWLWVKDFLTIRYEYQPVTLERYRVAWLPVSIFLDECEIFSPAHLRYEDASRYVLWREKGKITAGRNTALYELKILNLIMGEAVRRGLCAGNPILRHGIPRAPRRLKPALTEAQCDTIVARIATVQDATVREMLENSFLIARYQGCRLRETWLNPQTAVDLGAMTITFHIKGGTEHTTALHPKLVPLFERLKQEGRVETWHRRGTRGWASVTWWKFLTYSGLKKELGPALCFHCTRVTVRDRLDKAGVPLSHSMQYLGHKSIPVHQSYTRVKTSDLGDCTNAL